MRRAPASLLAALALIAPAAARTAEGELELRAELGAGVDTNPERTTGEAGRAQGFALALVRAKGTFEGERLRLAASLAEGARLYPGLRQASAAASRLEAQARLTLAEGLSSGAALSASDLTELRHELDQNALRGEVSLAWEAGALGASLTGGWTLFAPREALLRRFLASGPEAGLRAWWSPLREHVLSAGYGLWWAEYPRWEGDRRDDRTQTASVEYAHRGLFLAALGYAYSWNRSSAAGGDYTRHRLTARSAAFLPLDFTLALRASLQWSRYPEPLFLSQQLLLSEGQENQDAIEVRLTRPLWETLEVAVAFAFYRGETVQGAAAPHLSRSVMSATIGWSGPRRRPRRARARAVGRGPARNEPHGAASFTKGTP